MGFFDRFRGKPASNTAASSLPVASRNVSLTLIPKTQTNQPWILDTKFKPLALEGYSRSSVVYACIRALSTSVPEPPIKFYASGLETDQEEISVNPDLERLLKHPNELMSQFDMFEMATIHLSISGITYWWKERGNDGSVINLWPLRPDRVGPLYSNSTDEGSRVISHWVYHNPGTNEPVFLPRNDVWFTNYPDPLGPSGGMVEGLGPLIALAREVSSDNEATRFVATLLANYAQPGWAISIKGTVQDEDEARLLKMKFQSQFGGAHLGEAALLDADTTLTKLSFDLQELEFPALREFSETRIAAAFGTPAILVGLHAGLQRATYSNIQEARKDFTERTLEVVWRRIEDSLNRDLLPEFDVEGEARFDRSKVKALAETRLAETEPIQTGYTNGAVKLNEYRKALNLPPDETPAGDQYKAPPPSPFGGLPGMGGPGGLPPGIDPKDPKNTSFGARMGGNPFETARGKNTLPGWAKPSVAEDDKPGFLGKALKAGPTEPDDAELRETLLEAGLPAEVAEIVLQARLRYGLAAEALVTHLTSFLEDQAYRVAAKLPVDLSPDYLAIMFPEIEDQFLEDTMIPVFEHLFGISTDDASNNIQPKAERPKPMDDTQVPLTPESEPLGDISTRDRQLSKETFNAVSAIMRSEVGERIKNISETTRQAVAKAVQDGVDNNESLTQIRNRILQAAVFSPTRAQLIARTETAFLYNKTAIATYAATGQVRAVQVHDGIDYDEQCKEADGQVWSLEYALTHPIEHPNCRRAFAPVFDEDTLKSLKFNPYHDEIGRFARAFHDIHTRYLEDAARAQAASGKTKPSDYIADLKPRAERQFMNDTAKRIWDKLLEHKEKVDKAPEGSNEQISAKSDYNSWYYHAQAHGIVPNVNELALGRPEPGGKWIVEGTGVDDKIRPAITDGTVPSLDEWNAGSPNALKDLEALALPKAGEDYYPEDRDHEKDSGDAEKAKQVAMKLVAGRLASNENFQAFAKDFEGALAWAESSKHTVSWYGLTVAPQWLRFSKDPNENATAMLIKLWTMSSFDSNPLSISLQQAAARVFGLEEPKIKKKEAELQKSVDKLQDAYEESFEAFIKAEYAETQEQLKAAGIKELVLTRGLKLDPKAQSNAANGGKRLPADWNEAYYLSDTTGSPLQSWSTDRATAVSSFAENLKNGAIGIARIPAKDIVSTPYSGTGCLQEQEFVVKSGSAPVFVAMMKDGLRGKPVTTIYDRVFKDKPVPEVQ